MKILLVDVDSTIPNLALMKLSAYHKSIGNDVSFFNNDNPDVVYASVVFRKNKYKADGLRFFYPTADIIIGGPGYSYSSVLSDHIEHIMPEYGLYPNTDSSMGYTSRGCNNNCYFCIVRKKEGVFRVTAHPSEFYNPQFEKITFLDNNILLDKSHFFEVVDWCIEQDLIVDFNQGLDIRLVDNAIASKLSKMRFNKWYRFAFDDSKLAPLIEKKLNILKKKRNKRKIRCNVLCLC